MASRPPAASPTPLFSSSLLDSTASSQVGLFENQIPSSAGVWRGAHAVLCAITGKAVQLLECASLAGPGPLCRRTWLWMSPRLLFCTHASCVGDVARSGDRRGRWLSAVLLLGLQGGDREQRRNPLFDSSTSRGSRTAQRAGEDGGRRRSGACSGDATDPRRLELPLTQPRQREAWAF